MPTPDYASPVVWSFRPHRPTGQPEPPGLPGIQHAPAPHPKGPDISRPLRCTQCRQPVTTESRRIAIDGAHRHVFANPHGFIFEIGCFSAAPGCTAVGSPSPDFSWFAGAVWQVALCAACGLHLGWRFTDTDARRFYGLILGRLHRG